MKFSRLIYSLVCLTVFSIGGVQCKKIKEDLGKKFIISAMTSGLWLVDTFTDDNVDIKPGFADLEFRFKEDGTVIAINTVTSEETAGTWEGNVSDLTIYSNFPGAGEPLGRLNDTWKITNNTMSLVEAKPFVGNREAYLKLIKKS